VIVENKQPIHFIGCKLSEKSTSLSLRYLKKRFPHVAATQVVLADDVDYITKHDIRICSASRLLNDFI